MLFDTDVLIWAGRGNERAAALLEKDSDPCISVLSCMELLCGARNKREMAELSKTLSEFKCLPLSGEIGQRARLIIEHHSLSNALSAVDALIASTAIAYQVPLCSGNVKHFRVIPDLQLNPFRP